MDKNLIISTVSVLVRVYAFVRERLGAGGCAPLITTKSGRRRPRQRAGHHMVDRERVSSGSFGQRSAALD